MSELESNTDLIKQIMDLSSDIKKYYNCNSIKAITDPSRIKRPWLSIIKTILKPEYNIIVSDYHFTDRNTPDTVNYVHTKKYTFVKLDAESEFA